MKVKNFFKTENGRFNSPTVERIDIVVENGFAGSFGEPEEAGNDLFGYEDDEDRIHDL